MFSNKENILKVLILNLVIIFGILGLAFSPIAQAEISNVSITALDNIVNDEDAEYEFEFETDVAIPTNNITLTFPSGYIINNGVDGSLGDVADIICNIECALDSFVSIGTGEEEGLLQVVSVVQTVTDTVKITFNAPVNLSGEPIYFIIKKGIRNPSASGDYTITVKTGQDTTPEGDEATIVGDPDNFGYITISATDYSITSDDTQEFTAEAFDGNNNSLGDVTGDTSFSVYSYGEGDGGYFSGSTYNPNKVGTWTVEGCYGYGYGYGSDCDSEDITVSVGAIDNLSIEYSNDDSYGYGYGWGGYDVGSDNVYPGDSLHVYSVYRDAHNNFISNPAVTWTLIDETGGVSSTTDFSIDEDNKGAVFSAHLVGSATIFADNEDGLTAEADIDVYTNEEDFSSIEITPSGDTINADQTKTFAVEAFDSEGNSLGDVTEDVSFYIGEGAGGYFDGATYYPEYAGSYSVQAYYDGEYDSASLTITHGAITHFQVTPSDYSPTTDQTFSVTLTARDQFDNPILSLDSDEEISWSWSMGGTDSPAGNDALLAANDEYSFTNGVSETISGFKLTRIENAEITASWGEVSGTSDTINSVGGDLDDFVVNPLNYSPTTDDSFSVELTARDAEENVKTNYTGNHSVAWSYSGSASATSPAGNAATIPSTGNQSFSEGVATVSGFRLKTVGTSTVTATADTKTGTSTSVIVSPGVLDSFGLTGIPGSVTVGESQDVTITAYDAEENVKTDYAGSYYFTTTDEDALVASTTAFNEEDMGSTTLSDIIEFRSSGVHDVTITDSDADVSASIEEIDVAADAMDHFTITTETTSPTAGSLFYITVYARDQFGNILDGNYGGSAYTGRVALSTDATAPYSLVPNNYTFSSEDEGQKEFGVNLFTAEEGVTVTATDLDDDELTGSVGDIDVSVPGNLSVTAIDVDNNFAEAGAGFTSGFQWTLHITVPADEQAVQLKFGNFTNGESIIEAEDNIRYSSEQADDTDPVTVSGNDYGSMIVIEGDLNEEVPGRQIEVVVQMRVPEDATGGSYTGTYGIKSSILEP